MSSSPDHPHQHSPPPASSGIRGWLTRPVDNGHLIPLTGLWILGLDWLLFSSNAASLGLATPLSVILGFLLGSAGTLAFQSRFAGEAWWKSGVKALVAGILVGVPWPIGGTVAGGWILMNSGLSRLREIRSSGRESTD